MKRQNLADIFLKLAADALAVNMSFVLAYMFHFKIFNIFSLNVHAYSKVMFIVTVLWLIVFNLAGLYKAQPVSAGRVDGFVQILIGVFSASFLSYFLVIYSYKEALYSKNLLFISFMFALIFVNALRFFIFRYIIGERTN